MLSISKRELNLPRGKLELHGTVKVFWGLRFKEIQKINTTRVGYE
jgi:hypothetical protein